MRITAEYFTAPSTISDGAFCNNRKEQITIENKTLNYERTITFLSSAPFFGAIVALAVHQFFRPTYSALLSTRGAFTFMETTVHLAQEIPALWRLISLSFPLFTLSAGFCIGWYIYQMLFFDILTKEVKYELSEEEIITPIMPWAEDKLQLIVGLQHEPLSLDYVTNPEYLVLDETAMFQNVLVTGTIGTGKTVSVMYPLLKQAIRYQAKDGTKKAGMLILDVKGNFHEVVHTFAAECNREQDIVLITLDGKYRYNPLHKPHMESTDLAERSRQVMDLFNDGVKKDAFWDTKASQMMTECIRLLRCSTGYCSLGEVHRLVTDNDYLQKILVLMNERRALQVFIEKMESCSLREMTGAIAAENDLLLARLSNYLTPLTVDKVKELNRKLMQIPDDDSPAYQNLSAENLAGVMQMALMLSVEMMREIIFRAKSLINSNIMPNANPFDQKAQQWFWRIYPYRPSKRGVEALKECISLLPAVSEFDFTTCRNYFSGEFRSKAETTIETVKAVVTQMTAFFASSERIASSFSPARDKLNFLGFEEAIREGKIVVLAMNVAEYPKVSQTVAAYLKLDFQAEIIQRTSKGRYANVERPMFFLCDEYQEFVTQKDGNFYGISREAKCCSIVASQSCTSLLKALGGDRPSFETLYQNLISKITLRSDDRLTIEMMQLLIGKTDKTHISKNVSESASDSQKSAFIGGLVSNKASLSESISVSTQREALFEEKDFTQTLQAHKAIAFLARTDGMQEPTMIHLLPYFKPPILNLGKDEM